MNVKVQAYSNSEASVAMALAVAAQGAVDAVASGAGHSFVITGSKPVKDGWLPTTTRRYVHIVDGSSNRLAWFSDPEQPAQFLPLGFYVEL